MKKAIQPSIQQLKATDLVYQFRNNSSNDNDLSEKLGISKVTLYTRLKKSNWKKSELALIEKLNK